MRESRVMSERNRNRSAQIGRPLRSEIGKNEKNNTLSIILPHNLFKCSTATPAPLSSNRRVNCTFTRRRLIAQSIGWLLDFNSHSQMQPLTHVVSTVLLQPDFNLICSMSSTSGRWNHSAPHARLQCVFYEWMRRAASGGWFRLYSLC